jgi:hypothetical protein
MHIPHGARFAIVATTLAVLAGCIGAGSSSTPSVLAAGPLGISGARFIAPDAGRRPPTEIFNYFQTTATVPPSDPPPTNYEVTFPGNLVTQICGPTNPPCLDQPLYGPYNPFCPPSHGPSNPCYPIVTYNPSTNTTTVSFAGPVLYQNIPSHPGEYHFGLFLPSGDSQGGRLKQLCSNWSFPSQPNHSEPVVAVAWNSSVMTSNSWRYAEVFVEVSLTPGGPPAHGSWTEVAYVPKGATQPKLSFTNYGTQPLYVLSTGVVPNQAVPKDPTCQKNPACAENMALLAKLNFAGSPPPGSPGSKFIRLQFPPPSVLKPTQPSCPQ